MYLRSQRTLSFKCNQSDDHKPSEKKSLQLCHSRFGQTNQMKTFSEQQFEQTTMETGIYEHCCKPLPSSRISHDEQRFALCCQASPISTGVTTALLKSKLVLSDSPPINQMIGHFHGLFRLPGRRELLSSKLLLFF